MRAGDRERPDEGGPQVGEQARARGARLELDAAVVIRRSRREDRRDRRESELFLGVAELPGASTVSVVGRVAAWAGSDSPVAQGPSALLHVMDHHDGVPPRVLVADDDAIRESLARALEQDGYEVATVVDGVEALTRAHATPSMRSWWT
jgi:hypothetical protein